MKNVSASFSHLPRRVLLRKLDTPVRRHLIISMCISALLKRWKIQFSVQLRNNKNCSIILKALTRSLRQTAAPDDTFESINNQACSIFRSRLGRWQLTTQVTLPPSFEQSSGAICIVKLKLVYVDLVLVCFRWTWQKCIKWQFSLQLCTHQHNEFVIPPDIGGQMQIHTP